MALADDIADDHAFIDGVETVTVTPRTPVATAVTTVKALRRVLTRSDLSSAGEVGISPNDVPFHLWVSTLGGITPNPTDTITDAANVVYKILTAQLTTLGTRWRCVCRRQL